MDNFLKIKTACTRFQFFQYTMTLFIIQLVFALVFWILTTFTGLKNIFWLIPAFIILIEFPLLYLYFIQSARRIFSILGVYKISIFLALILFIFSLAGFVYAPALVVLIYVMLLLLPERDFDEKICK